MTTSEQIKEVEGDRAGDARLQEFCRLFDQIEALPDGQAEILRAIALLRIIANRDDRRDWGRDETATRYETVPHVGDIADVGHDAQELIDLIAGIDEKPDGADVIKMIRVLVDRYAGHDEFPDELN